MPMPRVVWYFDFVSPFAYLASQRLAPIAARAKLDYRPVLFAGLLQRWGHSGPAELAPKRLFTYRHVQWLAGRAGIGLQFPGEHPFNPLPYLRLSVALNNAPEVVDTIFTFLWSGVAEPGSTATFARLCERLQLDESARERAQAPEVKRILRENTERAGEQGVFGVPSFQVGDEVFWGYDAMDFLLDYLEQPQLLDSPAMRRLAQLPVGATRRSR